jgi:spore coat protein U domain-containing protein, fimbrial subunit CupE1/2/3/6
MMRRLSVVALSLIVSTTGQAACTISATGVAFGVYNPLSSSPADAVGTITISCTRMSSPAHYAIALGAGASGSYAGRAMRSGQTTLPYQLYTDAAHTVIWGDGSGGSEVVVGADNMPERGGTSTYSVYGRTPPRRPVGPGIYDDMIVMTVTF